MKSHTYKWRSNERDVKGDVLFFPKTLDPREFGKRGDSREYRVSGHWENLVIQKDLRGEEPMRTGVVTRVGRLVGEADIVQRHLQVMFVMVMGEHNEARSYDEEEAHDRLHGP